MVVLSVEGVLAKAVDSFFAEKKKFDHQESRIEGNAAQGEDEDAPAIINADQEEEQAQVQIEIAGWIIHYTYMYLSVPHT